MILRVQGFSVNAGFSTSYAGDSDKRSADPTQLPALTCRPGTSSPISEPTTNLGISHA